MQSLLIASGLTLLMLTNHPALAQTYRWVDEQGKVHFSDRKPPSQSAEDISNDLQTTNIDNSAASNAAQLERYDRDQSARQTETSQQNSHSKQYVQKREEDCRKAQQQLKILQGRVVFYDKDRNEIKVTEKERAQRARTFEQRIKKYCSSS